MLVETGGVSAESSTSGVLVNMVPKDGGNSFRFNASALFTDYSLQNDNLTDEIRGRGVTTVNKRRGSELQGGVRSERCDGVPVSR